jgi:tRNA threonylcarbamoyladenosine biosynthesis protein TsaB
MIILAADTSSDVGSVALLHDRMVVSQQVIPPGEPYSSSLLRGTRALLDAGQISFEEIDLLAVAAGPGSFTGLRVGLTSVKGWAEVLGIQIAAVSGLEAMATQVAHLSAPGLLIAAVMDARRGQIFGGLFHRRSAAAGEVEPAGGEVLTSPDEFAMMLRSHSAKGCPEVVACFDPQLIGPAIERQGFDCQIEVVSHVLAPFIGQIGYSKALRSEVVDALHLDANYIRRSDAEMNWRLA